MDRSLTDMAAAIEAQPGSQHAEQLAAEGIPAGPDKIRTALDEGGRATVTVRSRKSGEHVTVTLVCRKKNPAPYGAAWIPRNRIEGRVGFAEADCIEARDPRRDYPDNYVGRFYKDTGEWRPGKDADALREWTARKVILQALAGGGPVFTDGDVFLAAECCVCGHKLEDPQSIERGIGPECFGRSTSSKKAAHEQLEVV